MYIGAGIITLKIPYSRSLKEKRAVINKIKKRLVNNFSITVAEVGNYDMLNLTSIGFAVVSNNKGFIHTFIEKIFNYVDSNFDIIVISEEFDIMQY